MLECILEIQLPLHPENETKVDMFSIGMLIYNMVSNTNPKEASTMAMVVLPRETWENMTATINEVKNLLTEKTATEMNHKWVESTTARKMLGVSPKTWQTYRDKRIIPFSQIGRKIFVRRADLDNFMESHYIRKEVKL